MKKVKWSCGLFTCIDMWNEERLLSRHSFVILFLIIPIWFWKEDIFKKYCR